jgi:hypothetical protein
MRWKSTFYSHTERWWTKNLIDFNAHAFIFPPPTTALRVWLVIVDWTCLWPTGDRSCTALSKIHWSVAAINNKEKTVGANNSLCNNTSYYTTSGYGCATTEYLGANNSLCNNTSYYTTSGYGCATTEYSGQEAHRTVRTTGSVRANPMLCSGVVRM